MAAIVSLIRPEDFADGKLRLLFETLRDRDRAGKSFDLLPLVEDLHQRGLLAQVGGFAEIAARDAEAPSLGDVEELAQIVADRGVRRRTQTELQSTEQQLKAGLGSAVEVLADTQRRLSEIDADRVVSDLQPMSEVVLSTLDLLESVRHHQGGVTGLATRFDAPDRILPRRPRGDRIGVAGRPGMGKTAWAVNVAVHAAKRGGRSVAFFSLEMPRDQLGLRAFASEGRISLKRLREGGLQEGEYSRLNDAAAGLHGAPLFIDDGSALSPFDFRLRLRRLRARRNAAPLGLVVVDYLQLMSGAARFGSREQEVAFCSRSLKAIAKEFGVPVLALAQLNRKVEERKGPPLLSDLRESGSLEQDADVVLFLHPDPVSEDEAAGMSARHPALDGKAVELIVAKQRNGPTGSVSLWFRSDFTRFESRSYAGGAP